jgi:hypothetical protein
LAVALVLSTACSSHQSTGLPVATSRDFADIDLIAQQVREVATNDGDPHPTAAIVKSTMNAVFDHGSSKDPVRNREMYFIRIDGHFTKCTGCTAQPGYTFPPTRWLSFDWDPQQHGGPDFGYGSAEHLEEFGQVYAIDLGGTPSS